MGNGQPSLQSVGTSLNRAMLAILVTTSVLALSAGFFSVKDILEAEALQNLEELIEARVEAESPRFVQAEDNIRRFENELLRRFEAMHPEFAEREFHRCFMRSKDGLWRVRPDFNTHQLLPSLYIQHDAVLGPSLYIRAVASYQLLSERGPALVPPYYSLYMDFVENGLMVYSPHVNWGEGATRGTNNHQYPTMSGASPEANPERRRFWTPVYFDEEAQEWMVSVIQPLDWRGEWVGTVGHDVAIDHLLAQVLEGTVDGPYELILSGDGGLIAHPGFSEQISASGGDLALENLDDELASRINALASNLKSYPAIIEDPHEDFYYAVAKIRGPGWLLVNVYPKSLATSGALNSLLLPGLTIVLMMIGALILSRRFLRRIALEPLEHLEVAIERLSQGHTEPMVATFPNNEFGRLARSFEDLAHKLDDREKMLLEARNVWQRTFDSVLEYVTIVDTDFNLTQANETFLKVYEFTLRDAIGKNRIKFFSEKSQPMLQERYERIRDDHQVQQFSTYSEQRQAHFEMTLVPMLNHDDELGGIIEVTRDVSESRHLEDQLRQSQKMEAIGLLAGGIAHDFNNLLQIVIGYAEALELEAEEKGVDETSVKRILEASNKASTLTQQLLAFGRRQVIQSKPIDANSAISSTLTMVERLIESNVNIEFIGSDRPLVISADMNQLEQVLINLCLNSRDAMPNGGKMRVTVQAAEFLPIELADRSGSFVRISVEDTGEGIDPLMIENVFEPFYTTKEKYKGTGLGLATAYGIAQQHGGTIMAESVLTVGSTFSVYLPLIESDVLDSEQDDIINLDGLGDECILLADDDDVVRDLLARSLKQAGYRVISAKDGGEAVELYRSHSTEIDLLLLDMMMPAMSGQQVIELVRAEQPDIPCLLASGYSEESQRAPFLLDEKTGFISKPFKSQMLLMEVRKLLDREKSGKSIQN